MTTPARPIKVSTLYFRACLAAEENLPAESLALIKRRDELYSAWIKAGLPPIMEQSEMLAASKAVNADPLASVAMNLRRLGNEAADKERQEQSNVPGVGA